MDIKKIAPWNWFKKENASNGHAVPVKHHTEKPGRSGLPRSLFHNEVDRLFDEFFKDVGLSPFDSGSRMLEGIRSITLKPRLDLSATEKEYIVSVEIPGVSEKEIALELRHDTLVIRGEKQQEKEEKNKHFYRIERSYGEFQRTLSLPEDANRDSIKAEFRNGILKITIPRVTLPGSRSRQVEINYA